MTDRSELTTEANTEPKREGAYIQRFLGSVVAAYSPRFVNNYTWLGRLIVRNTEPGQEQEQAEETDRA